MVATIARYHRGSEPRAKHVGFGALSAENRRRVEILSAILRVADGLDRGHIGAIARVKVRWTERALRLTPVPDPRAKVVRLELWGAERKSALLEQVTGLPVVVVS